MTDASRRPVTSPGRFDEPIGLDADGILQRRLTPQEIAHLEEVRARVALDRAEDE